MNVLSLFDGMSCGMLAMKGAEINVERYVAYEVDKYAIKTSTHNFPYIEQRGDVFNADFTEFNGFDFLVGGSPCTYWSIAQTKNRETQAHGIGWELFNQYVRAVKEVQPKYFIYENNKSMSNAIKQSITDTFGFEPICINSALVSAQSRQRLYWVGIKQSDGSYIKANIEQPVDRGILLKDVLDDNFKPLSEKEMDYMVRDHLEQRWAFCNKPAEDDKSKCLVANIRKGVPYNVVEEPVCIEQRGRYADNGDIYQHLEPNLTGKSNALTTVQKDNLVGEPIRIGTMPNKYGEQKTGQGNRIYSEDGKAVPLSTGQTKTGWYAIKTVNGVETEFPVYEVLDGMITVKGNRYPIKLSDGYYILRKLSVLESMRLQTVPEWFEFPVSNSQAYKMLGNGWTVEVIIHILNSIMKEY